MEITLQAITVASKMVFSLSEKASSELAVRAGECTTKAVTFAKVYPTCVDGSEVVVSRASRVLISAQPLTSSGRDPWVKAGT